MTSRNSRSSVDDKKKNNNNNDNDDDDDEESTLLVQVPSRSRSRGSYASMEMETTTVAPNDANGANGTTTWANGDEDEADSTIHRTRPRPRPRYSWHSYAPTPTNEVEAQQLFRQNAIDKAHEISAETWLEHIDNHHENLHHPYHHRDRHHIIHHPSHIRRLSSLTATTTNSNNHNHNHNNHSNRVSFLNGSGSSTLRKRRSSISSSNTRRSSNKSHNNNNRFSIVSGATVGSSLFSVNEEDNDEVNTTADEDDDDDDDAKQKHTKTTTTTHKKKNKKKTMTTTTTTTRKTWETYYNRNIQLLVSLALYSYVGQYLRYLTEYLFGNGCLHGDDNHWDTTGWNNMNNLILIKTCSTIDNENDVDYNDSTTSIGYYGTAFFIDLITNILGCFLMGLLVSGDGESVAINLPMAALPQSCFFQNWIVTHVGLRTGLCGAFTTFASWNTQLVVMVCQNQHEYSYKSHVLWGYIIGLYTSLQSYQFGTAVAYALSRYFNPNLAMEADIIIDKKAIGIQINRDLPNFERRFLHSIVLNTNNNNNQNHNQNHNNENIHHLHAWKDSTKDCRSHVRTMIKYDSTHHNNGDNNNNNNYVQELQEIERYLLVDKIKPRQELLDLARDAGWNVGALYNWAYALDNDNDVNSLNDHEEEENIASYHNAAAAVAIAASPSTSSPSALSLLWECCSWKEIEVIFNLVLFLLCTGFFLYGVFHYKDKNDELSKNVTNQFLSALLTPFGTFSRWYLSRFNGSITKKNWEWLPIGTFMANMIASIISVLSVAINTKLVPPSYILTSAFLGAIKSGYAGTFSTVSTFAAETTGLFKALPRYFWGYYYSFGSLFIALILGICSYAWTTIVV